MTDAAADRINAVLAGIAADPRNAAASAAIVRTDADRIEARIQRSQQARPSVPDEVWLLMLFTVAVMIGSSAAFTHPSVGRVPRWALLAGTAVVFGLTLAVTYDIGRPFDGVVGVSPTAIQSVDVRLSHLPDGSQAPPCGADGRPL